MSEDENTFVGEECGHETDELDHEMTFGCPHCGTTTSFKITMIEHGKDSDVKPDVNDETEDDDSIEDAESDAETIEWGADVNHSDELPWEHEASEGPQNEDGGDEEKALEIESNDEWDSEMTLNVSRTSVTFPEDYRVLQKIAGQLDDVAGNQSRREIEEDLRDVEDDRLREAIEVVLEEEREEVLMGESEDDGDDGA